MLCNLVRKDSYRGNGIQTDNNRQAPKKWVQFVVDLLHFKRFLPQII